MNSKSNALYSHQSGGGGSTNSNHGSGSSQYQQQYQQHNMTSSHQVLQHSQNNSSLTRQQQVHQYNPVVSQNNSQGLHEGTRDNSLNKKPYDYQSAFREGNNGSQTRGGAPSNQAQSNNLMMLRPASNSLGSSHQTRSGSGMMDINAARIKIGTTNTGGGGLNLGSNASTPAASNSQHHIARPSMTQKPPTADMRNYHHINNPSNSSSGSSNQQIYHQKNLKFFADPNSKNLGDEGQARQPSSANVPRRDANGGGVAGYRSSSTQSNGNPNHTRSVNQSSERPSVNPQVQPVPYHHKSVTEQTNGHVPSGYNQNSNSAGGVKSRNPSNSSNGGNHNQNQQNASASQFSAVLSSGNDQIGSARGNSASADQNRMLLANLPRSTTNKTYSSLTTTNNLAAPQTAGQDFGVSSGNLSGRVNVQNQLPPFIRSGGVNTQPPTQPRQSAHTSTITAGSSASSSNLTSQANSSNVSTLKSSLDQVNGQQSSKQGLSQYNISTSNNVSKQISSQSINQTNSTRSSAQQMSNSTGGFVSRHQKIDDKQVLTAGAAAAAGSTSRAQSANKPQQVMPTQQPQVAQQQKGAAQQQPSSRVVDSTNKNPSQDNIGGGSSKSRPQSGTREQAGVNIHNVNNSSGSRTQNTANALQFKSQTHNPATLQQLIKDATQPGGVPPKQQQPAQPVHQQPQAQQQPQHQPHPPHSSSTRLKSASRAEPQSSGNQLLPSRNQLNGGLQHPAHQHKSQQINNNQTIAGNQSNSKLNLKAFFEINQENISVTQKLDPQTGVQTKIQSFTTLNVNEMFHENASIEGDENEDTRKLPLQPGTRIVVPNHEATKCSLRRNGIVRAYAANTNQGLVRSYNEDRVSIILNIVKPEHRQHEQWPKCSFFGVYDGHGGHLCAEFLRDNLHHFVVREDSFPWDPETALAKGFQKAEDKFMREVCLSVSANGEQTLVERSGSCAIVVLIVGEMCYVANVGDSRALMSSNGGAIVQALSQDHKPSDPDEYQRIIAGGGQVYQTTTATQSLPQNKEGGGIVSPRTLGKEENQNENTDYIVGPIRVLPGRLSVSRTFGDPEAKFEFRGGNPNVVVCKPDIKAFKITKDHDFIILGCDGIFDKLTNEDCSICAWNSVTMDNKDQKLAQNVHQQSGLAVESILKNSLYRQSLDNVTVVMIAFQNFKRQVFGKSKHSSSDRSPLKSNAAHHLNSQQVSSKQGQQVHDSNEALRLNQDAKENNSHNSNTSSSSNGPNSLQSGTNKPHLSPFVSLRGTSKSINGNVTSSSGSTGSNGGIITGSNTYSSTMKSPMPNNQGTNDENVPPSSSSQQKTSAFGSIGFSSSGSSIKQFSSTMNGNMTPSQMNQGNLNKPPTSNFYGNSSGNGSHHQQLQSANMMTSKNHLALSGSVKPLENDASQRDSNSNAPLREKTNQFLNRPSSSSQGQLTMMSGVQQQSLGVRKPSLTKQAPSSLLTQDMQGVIQNNVGASSTPGTSTNQHSSTSSMIYRSMQTNSNAMMPQQLRPMTTANNNNLGMMVNGGSSSTNGHHYKSTSSSTNQQQQTAV